MRSEQLFKILLKINMTFKEFRSIKVPLKSVLKDPDKDLAFFQQQSNNINIIVTLGYQFIRLYLLTLFHRNKPLPQINDILCKNVLSVICFPKTKRKDNTLINTLKIFYHASFKRLLPEDLVFDPANLSPICQSLATEMTTSLNNNIHIHFVDRLKRIIKYLIQQEPEFSEISKGQIRRGAAIVIDGLWEKDSSKMSGKLLEIYQFCLEEFIPNKPYKESLGYDLEANTQKYLYYSMKMNVFLESHDLKLFQSVCLRKSVVPKNIPIDTKSLIYIGTFPTYKNKKFLSDNYQKNNLYKIIWNHYFKVNSRLLKHHKVNPKTYQFMYSIDTDGVICTLKFINTEHTNLFKKRWKNSESKKAYQKHQNDKKQANKKANKEVPDYNRLTSKLDKDTKAEYSKKHLVGCDPGMSNN